MLTPPCADREKLFRREQGVSLHSFCSWRPRKIDGQDLFLRSRPATTLFRFARELRGAFGNDDSRQHARCPNVDSAPQINGFVQRATLYADRLRGAAPLMPQPGPTVRAKSALQRVTRVGRT